MLIISGAGFDEERAAGAKACGAFWTVCALCRAIAMNVQIFVPPALSPLTSADSISTLHSRVSEGTQLAS